MPEYQSTRVPKYQSTGVPEHQSPEHQSTRVPEYREKETEYSTKKNWKIDLLECC